MILFPAVDIKNGQCVRLAQGKSDEVTVFSPDPVAQAEHWAGLGAEYLHVVDLDGAFEGTPRNFDLIQSICRSVKVPVQLGGGIRDLATARAYLSAGVARLIIGTMALADPATFSELCRTFPGRIGVSLDAVDGKLKTKGWVEDSGLTVSDVLPRLADDGAAFLVYTDISRDGEMAGTNLEAYRALSRISGLRLIASGGITYEEEIRALAPMVYGAILGKALYSGLLDLKRCLALASEDGKGGVL